MSLKSIVLPWLISLVLQGTLVFVLLFKRMGKKFPRFLAYSASSFLGGVIQYGLYQSAHRMAYFYAYWITELLGMVLGLAVVFEIFGDLFTPYPALRKLAKTVFRASMVFLALLGGIVASTQAAAAHYPWMSGLVAAEEATRVLEVGLLFSLFLFASVFGLHWRQYMFGIALGLGVFAAVELVAVTVRLQFGVTANVVFNIVRTFSFNASLLIWIGYILAPELATAPAEMPKRAQLEQWNRAVMELIYQ